MLGAIAVLVLTPVLWILSHKYFRFIYFGNIGNAILKEILECFFISFFLVCFVGAIISRVFPGLENINKSNEEGPAEVVEQEKNDNIETLDEYAFEELLEQYAAYGWVDNLDALFETLYSNAPMKIESNKVEKHEYVSTYSSSKYHSSNNSSNCDFILNWSYPNTFKEDREEAFKLLSELNGTSATFIDWQVQDNNFIPIEEVSDGEFQRVAPNATNGILYYFGDVSNNKPNGFGAILTLHSGNYLALVPSFVGHFSNGLVKGYGIQFSDGINKNLVSGYSFSGVQMEGMFDFSTEDTLIGVYNDLNGQGIVYYNNNCSYLENYLAELSISDTHLYSDENVNASTSIPVVTNYPVLRPSVKYEGKFSNGDFAETLEYYYPSNDNCYGEICFSGEYTPDKDIVATGLAYAADGTIISAYYAEGPVESSEIIAIGYVYYPSGILEFAGEFYFADFVDAELLSKQYNEGKYYDPDGILIGEYKNGEFTWVQNDDASESRKLINDSNDKSSNSYSWNCGYESGYDDGWKDAEYNDDSTKYPDASINAEEYMSGYETGYITGRLEAVN